MGKLKKQNGDFCIGIFVQILDIDKHDIRYVVVNTYFHFIIKRHIYIKQQFSLEFFMTKYGLLYFNVKISKN